jgi:hypothetical protein
LNSERGETNNSMEVDMNRRKIVFAATIGSALLISAGLVGFAERYELFEDDNDDDDDDDEGDSLIKSVRNSKVNLQQGLAAGEQEGQPISGRFEVENGKFQLSVYTTKDGQFSDVRVDHTTAKVAKVEPITSDEDLAAAQSQSAAMAGARSSLKDAVERATAQNIDFRAVGVVPGINDGHPAASVLLLNGSEFKMVVLPLE